MASNNLIIDLPMEEITEGQTPDISGNKLNATVLGALQLLPDDKFGSCLLFDGKTSVLTVDIANIKYSGLTLMGWFKLTNKASQPFFTLLDADQNSLFQFGIDDMERLTMTILNQEDRADAAITPKNGVWFHAALTASVSGNKTVVSLYLDGLLAHTFTLTALMPDASKLLIGQGSKETSELFFQGNMAGFKCFDAVVGQDVINEDIETAATVNAIFKTTYPLDFEFIDDEIKNVFYIANLDQGKDQTVELQITNASSRQVILSPLTEASASSFHFELRFRPNTFKDQAIAITQLADGWQASKATINTNNTLSLFISYVGTEDLKLASASMIDIGLSYRSADGQLGGRGTQALMAYQNIHYPDNAALISGHRVKQVDIVNQRGKKNLPLHIGFIGSNTVLNDADLNSKQGTKNNLRFRLINTMNTSYLQFNSVKNTPNTGKQTKLTLTFDSVDDRKLATDDELQSIAVRTAGNWATVTKLTQGRLPVFVIDGFTVDQLPAETALDIIMDNIITSQPSGISNLYINYQNIPGYWDGEIILEIEKTPIIHRSFKQGKHVGIGVEPDENYQVKIGGNLRLEPDSDDEEMFVIGSKDGKKSYFQLDMSGNVGVGTNPDQKLDVNGNLKVRGDIEPSTGNGVDNGIIFQGSGKGDSASIKYYPQFSDKMALELKVSNDPDDHIILAPSGSVGVGTYTPKAKLDVNGSIKTKDLIADGDVSAKGLKVAGGIAAKNLNVSDNLKVDGDKPIIFQRYTKLGDSIHYDTKYSANDYNASIAGFRCLDGDMQESGAGDIMQIYMYVKESKWFIRADFRSHHNAETWYVDVMFVRKELSIRKGY